MNYYRRFLSILLTGMLLILNAQSANSQTFTPGAVVRAVLFYAPDCGHCHYVITEVLPPLFEQYGNQLSIVGVDISQPGGQALFISALKFFSLESGGVPFLVIDDTYLIGSLDIPEKFPGLIQHYLAQGGVGWPPIPGLADAIRISEPTRESTPTEELIKDKSGPATAVPTQEDILTVDATEERTISATAAPTNFTGPVSITQTPTPGLILSTNHIVSAGGRFFNDPLGNSLSILVLVSMIFSVLGAIRSFWSSHTKKISDPIRWEIPVLCVIGLGVAGYLFYIEATRTEAFCGPVGDCNTVQQSAYARLFGSLPVAVLGLAGYVSILIAWSIRNFSNQEYVPYASLAMFGLCAIGTLFSIYLTFLEPFVIGATCAWCLTSAVLMTALLWLSLPSGKSALSMFGRRN
jgi:uncharacterized membrane protein/thiol-disulfide isomerase/thioredoxin